MTFQVGGYRATELIGRGSTAEVWLGAQLSNGSPVALKVFPPDRLAAAQREAALAATVDHPHVVSVLDVVADVDRVALVTEYAAGGDLDQLLVRRGTLSPGETLTVLVPLAAALATAHERGVVHGDLSARNVVFDRAGRPLLADLGAARAAVELGGPVWATPTDAAPELARGARPAPACDIFSVGSLAMACLTGRHAWPADDLRDVLIQAAAGQWPDPGDTAGPPELIAIIRSLLEHDPDRRPGAASLVMDLKRAGRPDPVDLALDGPPAHRSPPTDPVRHALLLGSAGDEFRLGNDFGSPRRGSVEVDHPVPEGPRGGRHDARPDPDTERQARARAITRLRSDRVIRTQPPARRHRLPRRLLRHRRLLRRIVGMTAQPAARPSHILRAGSPRRFVRVGLISVACLVVAGLAGGAGLWWAGVDRSDPISASGSGMSSSPSVAGTAVRRSPPTGSSLAGKSSTRSALRTSSLDRSVSPTTSMTVDRTSATVTRSVSAKTPDDARRTPRDSPVSSGTSGRDPGPADWTQTVQALDSARARALVARDAALLDTVYTPDSPARSADRHIIEDLLSGGLRVSGALHVVRSVHAVQGSPTTVEVDDSLPAYTVLDVAGHVVGTTAARSLAPRVLVLVRTAGGFRISRIETA